MKAVITGVTGLRNRGVEALVSTTIEQLLKRHPDLDISILTETPDYDRVRLTQANVTLFNMKQTPKGWAEKLRVKSSKFNKTLAPEYGLLKDASVVIASGGDLFTSDYPGALKFNLIPLKLALHAGVPVVFLGQSIAFKNDEHAKLWADVARRSHLVTVREKASYNYVTKDLGLSPDLVKHTADSAFLLQPPPPDAIARLIRSYGVSPDRPVVAIAPSQGISRFSNSNSEQHLKSWCAAVTFILNELEAQVLIVPHAQNTNLSNDDRMIATKLHKQLNFHPDVHIAGADHSASEFKGLIGACDLVVAERMHAAIAGLSSSVCTVVVGYSIKAEGIMIDLLGPNVVQDGLLISVQQLLNEDTIRETLRAAWSKRHDVASQLNAVLPRVKQAAASNFDLISQILS